MAQWTQTLEPYIRVHEEVKSLALNPTAGEDLIIGVTFISDAGPSTPTLIRGQKEFLATYTSQDLTQEYIESLNQLYTGDDKTLAANMWANAYRLAGSNTLLVVRASKANGMYYAKPLTKGDNSDYILRDGELLKKVPSFKIVLDTPGDYADHDSDGWNINIRGVGIFGNRTTDDGPQYDYFVNDLPSLVDNLNDTSKFFSPSYSFYEVAEQIQKDEILDIDLAKSIAKVVVFNEVYLGANILDKTDPRTQGITVDGFDYYVASSENSSEIMWRKIENPTIEDITNSREEIYNLVSSLPTSGVEVGTICKVMKEVEDNDGLLYMITCQPNWTDTNPNQHTLDLNGSPMSGFTASKYYATNVYNSTTPLAVRIRRFNHDAVITKELSSADKATLTENGKSPYIVLKNVLDTYTKNGTREPAEINLKRDFYEVAIFDPSINGEVSFFNIGHVLGRGDMEVSEVNELIKMIQLNLPDDLHDLGLNYYDYEADDHTWTMTDELNTVRWTPIAVMDEHQTDTIKQHFRYTDEMYKYNCKFGTPEIKRDDIVKIELNNPLYFRYNGENTVYSMDELMLVKTAVDNTIYTIETQGGITNYKYVNNGEDQLFADLTIKISGDGASAILNVSDSDFKKAMDQILEDEVYVTEGLSDLGNTELSFQSYLANMAISETGNYFYPISTVNSTNYMTIGNSATKISQDSYKLYMSAPWDIDTGTLGWKFYAAPSVLYWEAVARNRRNNNEFASIIGQSYGLVQYQRPVTEFNKKTRQLLLSKRVNTVYWNISTQAWNMNDCYTKENENNIMNEDGNSRLMIRISKAMPVILRQFIGRKITEPLCAEVRGVIDYFFRTTIIPMNVTVDAYQIFCDYDEALARQNKIKVVVNCRYSRSLKFIEVYNRAFDVGMDISNPN